MEMKVGGLIVIAILLLAAFVGVMSGFSLQPTYRVFVEFDNPAGLQSGSSVRIAGVRVGRVNSLEFRGGQVDAQGKLVPPIRVVAEIAREHQKAIHADAVFFITVQGVLGEMHLAIDPGSPGKPPLPDNAVVRGVSPPRLDQLLGESYDLLHQAASGLNRNERQLGETFDGLHKTLRGTGRLFEKHEADISNIVGRVDSLAGHAEETLAAVREQYVDGPRIERILNRLDHTTRVVDENLEPLLQETRALLSDGHKLSAFLADDRQIAVFRELSHGSQDLLVTAKKAADDAAAIAAHVRAGKGTAGAMLMNETLYDDLQEMVRDLKQNPWKIMWKE